MKTTEIMREGEHIMESTHIPTASSNGSQSGEVGGVDFSGLEHSIDNACAEIDRLRATRDELLKALKAVWLFFDQPSNEDRRLREVVEAAIAKAEGR